MLKELNTAFASVCSVTATTASALEEGSKILLLKGVAAKQVAALEAVKSISEAQKSCSKEELQAAQEILNLVE